MIWTHQQSKLSKVDIFNMFAVYFMQPSCCLKICCLFNVADNIFSFIKIVSQLLMSRNHPTVPYAWVSDEYNGHVKFQVYRATPSSLEIWPSAFFSNHTKSVRVLHDKFITRRTFIRVSQQSTSGFQLTPSTSIVVQETIIRY